MPNLRFPEYFNKRDWRHDFLGHISIILRGGSPRPIEEYLTNESSGLNWLKIGDVDKGSKYITHTSEKVIKQALTKTREVSPGDLIMSNSMSFGRPYISKIKTCIHDGWIAVTESNENINTDYLYYFILSDGSQKYFIRAAAGGGIKNLNAEIIKMLPVQFPCEKEERQKIADCLSSLDDLIAAEGKKLSALRDHKKGLMQKLFPAEGETVPKWRFPEFRYSGEWEKTSFKQVFTKFQYGLSAAAKVFDGKNKYIRITDIDDASRRYLCKNPVSPDCELDDTYLVQVGDILFARTGATAGKAYLYSVNDGILYFAGFLIRGNVNKKFCPQFILAQTLSTNYKKWVNITSARSGQPGINANEYESFTFFCPSLPEQQKIADCLTEVDKLITAQSEKIEALKAHKKGLMQGLFPSIQEVDV